MNSICLFRVMALFSCRVTDLETLAYTHKFQPRAGCFPSVELGDGSALLIFPCTLAQRDDTYLFIPPSICFHCCCCSLWPFCLSFHPSPRKFCCLGGEKGFIQSCSFELSSTWKRKNLYQRAAYLNFQPG